MYIKVFESRESGNSYIVKHEICLQGLVHGAMTVTNQNKVSIKINEQELFHLIDTFYKGKLNETQK